MIEESVLYRPVGGTHGWRRQLRRLVEAAGRPNITFQVVRTSVGLHPAEGRAFIVLGFADPADPKIVYLEHLNESHLIDDTQKVAPYVQAFDRLRELALPSEDSVALIRRLEGNDDALGSNAARE